MRGTFNLESSYYHEYGFHFVPVEELGPMYLRGLYINVGIDRNIIFPTDHFERETKYILTDDYCLFDDPFEYMRKYCKPSKKK